MGAAGQWCILRCSGRSTLGLAESLAGYGFDVWTPARDVMVRRSRWNVARSVRLPLTPTFVFACAQRLEDLLGLASAPRKRHADFSVFHYLNRIPLIDDDELKPLRVAEHKAVPKAKGGLAQGSSVRITEGVYEGHVGVIDRSNSQEARVWISIFGRHHKVTVAAYTLKPTEELRRAA
jgi:hypothetical protein